MYTKACILIVAFLLSFEANSQHRSFAEHLKFIGIAVEEPGYHIWDTSPVLGDDGKIHLFVSRWPINVPFDDGWRRYSEIAHYVGDSPEGPFRFSDITLQGTGQETWDKYAPHNSVIKKIGDTYVLLFIANNDYHLPPHPSNQCIGMAISKSPCGPWEKLGDRGLILKPSENKDYWNFNSVNGVNNPGFMQHPDGGFLLYYKSSDNRKDRGWNAMIGLAVGENIEGPYVQLPFPVTANPKPIEAPVPFMYHGKFALLTTDNQGIIETGGGLLWISDDGIHFNDFEQGYKRMAYYVDYDPSKAKCHYGKPGKFEELQVLNIDGKPGYFYIVSGTNIYGGDGAVSYIFKYIK